MTDLVRGKKKEKEKEIQSVTLLKKEKRREVGGEAISFAL